jgi:hypothetical protein
MVQPSPIDDSGRDDEKYSKCDSTADNGSATTATSCNASSDQDNESIHTAEVRTPEEASEHISSPQSPDHISTTAQASMKSPSEILSNSLIRPGIADDQ